MITVSLETFFLIYLTCGLSLIAGLWYYYDRRDRNLYAAERSQAVFHCIKCGHIYTDKKGHDVAECPKCKFENGRLKF